MTTQQQRPVSSLLDNAEIGGTCLLAIDQGTTNTRAVLFTAGGKQLAVAQKELTLHYPQDGWVEQNAVAIWQDTLAVCGQILQSSGIQSLLPQGEPDELDAEQTLVASKTITAKIAALGITNQRETTIVWDKASGEPVYNAIVWQDRRTAKLCEKLKAAGHEAMVSQKTGLLLDPYFCATKLAWVLDNVPGVRQRAERGELLFGTVDCYLLWQFTEGCEHATDISNACRTLLFNIHSQQWDSELLSLFNIPASMLPEVKDNTANFGQTSKKVLGIELPIAAMMGDQQAAMVGQGCLAVGDIKSTYGTGCFMLLNTGEQALVSKHRLLTTVAYRLNGKICYAIEGAVFVAGAAIQWLRDGLNLLQHASDSEAMAASVADNGGVYFVPALTGLGAPYWQPDARGMIVGISRDTQAAHIVRAALEAQAFQTRDLIQAMLADGGKAPTVLRVDGGLVVNKLACQMLADILQVEVEVPEHSEATVWGVACLAGLQVGVFNNVAEIAAKWQLRHRYSPAITQDEANRLYAGWQQAVGRLLDQA